MLEIDRCIVLIIASHGTGFTERVIKTPKGEEALYKGNQKRTIWTLMWKIEITRAYYHGKEGWYVPLDDSLPIPECRYSYAVHEAMSLSAKLEVFGEHFIILCGLCRNSVEYMRIYENM